MRLNYENITSKAFIEIEDGTVRLLCTWNPDASCCEEDETGTIVQEEEYGSEWNFPQNDPRLVEDFWGVWDEINGKTCGGITLNDERTYEEIEKDVSRFKVVSIREIPTLGNGIYFVG